MSNGDSKVTSRFTAYWNTFWFLSGVAFLGGLLEPFIGYKAVGYLFLLGVLTVGMFGTYGPVLASAFASALVWDFFFIPPKLTFVIDRPEDLMLCVCYFVAALITGILTNRVRRHESAIQERESVSERLRESEKLHQALLSSISHEVRTPLTTIMSAASALADELSPNTHKFKRALANELASASDRMNRVIENLLDMTRLSSGVHSLKKEWHDVSDLVGVTLARLGTHVDRHFIRVELGETLPLVSLDFRLFEHVLSNLILNAVQYTPAGSEIFVRCYVAGATLELVVEDTGKGIDPVSLPRVFDKFYRVPGTPAGGTGLGLSIARSIVELHGGTIRVENSLTGGGARFLMALPLGQPPQMPKEAHAANPAH